MARAGSDVDVKGVLIPPRRYLIGYRHRCEQVNDIGQLEAFLPSLPEDLQRVAAEEKLEGTVYTLQKYLRLAADGNPNMLEVLFSRDQELVKCTPAGERLRAGLAWFAPALDSATGEAAQHLLAARQRFLERDYDAAMAAVLESATLDRDFQDGLARKAMLLCFAVVGEDDERLDGYRRQLATLLY